MSNQRLDDLKDILNNLGDDNFWEPFFMMRC